MSYSQFEIFPFFCVSTNNEKPHIILRGNIYSRIIVVNDVRTIPDDVYGRMCAKYFDADESKIAKEANHIYNGYAIGATKH